jgi:hypothetical protein
MKDDMELDRRELAAVLAALRFWQRKGSLWDGPEREIATDSETLEELSVDEIDSLCERLNFGRLSQHTEC